MCQFLLGILLLLLSLEYIFSFLECLWSGLLWCLGCVHPCSTFFFVFVVLFLLLITEILKYK